MITLLTDTANQTLLLSLDEGRQYYSTPFTHYLITLQHEENSIAGTYLAQVATVTSESQRITQLVITTESLLLPGRYRYYVYGQNSNSNLDPTNILVVGMVEQGWLYLTDNAAGYTLPTITIDNDFIYG
jgi:hypothetical protein